MWVEGKECGWKGRGEGGRVLVVYNIFEVGDTEVCGWRGRGERGRVLVVNNRR